MWYGGRTRATFCKNFGSRKIGIHSPAQNDIGKYTRFTIAGAEFGLAI